MLIRCSNLDAKLFCIIKFLKSGQYYSNCRNYSNKMIIVQVNGGLGNQLFQYCSAKVLSIKKNVPLRLDLTYFDQTGKKDGLTHFNITDKIATSDELMPYYGRSIFKKIAQRLIPSVKRDIFKE